MRPFLMLIFSCILILVGCQSRTEDYDSASIRSPEPNVDGVSDSPYTSNVSCYSKDRVRAVIEAKRVHCTQPYGFACQPLRGLVTSPAKQASYHACSGNEGSKPELSITL